MKQLFQYRRFYYIHNEIVLEDPNFTDQDIKNETSLVAIMINNHHGLAWNYYGTLNEKFYTNNAIQLK